MGAVAIILANGEISDPDLLKRRIESLPSRRVFAADGGSRHARALELIPELVIGDLDSLDEGDRNWLSSNGAQFETYPAAKDETDLELALRTVHGQGYEHIILLGALGGRMDMALANLLLLTSPDLAKLRVEIWRQNQTAWVIRPPGTEISGENGDTLSLIPLNGEARGITTTNLAYPLEAETLWPGPGRGISNQLNQPQASVAFEQGLLLAVHTPGHA